MRNRILGLGTENWHYDKVKLVPFGEFLPLESFFKKFGLKTITNNFGSFTKSNDRKIYRWKRDTSSNYGK